jgi:hypothetical protein
VTPCLFADGGDDRIEVAGLEGGCDHVF